MVGSAVLSISGVSADSHQPDAPPPELVSRVEPPPPPNGWCRPGYRTSPANGRAEGGWPGTASRGRGGSPDGGSPWLVAAGGADTI